eukprot:GHVU01070724.1.p2 GENE.GHVU01070724.1~~GHVU01070724.1.p2  ORF type:complete len:122 (+),score=2.13 GHVU01070724.1:665-1030(+)
MDQTHTRAAAAGRSQRTARLWLPEDFGSASGKHSRTTVQLAPPGYNPGYNLGGHDVRHDIVRSITHLQRADIPFRPATPSRRRMTERSTRSDAMPMLLWHITISSLSKSVHPCIDALDSRG